MDRLPEEKAKIIQKAARQAQDAQQAAEENGETRGPPDRYSVVTLPDGKKFVKADRMVIFGNDPREWRVQLEDYINGKIRRGEDVTLIGADGDELVLTETSAGKLSSPYTNDGRTMSDAAYERKVNAAAHIDELAQTSVRGKTVVADHYERHGSMADGGWNYRTAYFKDFNGKYYEVKISVAQGSNGKLVYNIGKMQERSIPQKISGSSSAGTGALRGDASQNFSEAQSTNAVTAYADIKTSADDISSITSIRRPERESQEKFSADDTTATPQENDKTALAYFGRTYKWSETGYVLLNGARLDISGRHEGGSGGYRSARLGIQAEIRGCEKLQRDRKIRLKSEDFSRIWSECRDSNPRPLGPEGWSDIFRGHFRAFQSLSARKISQRHPFRHG